MVVSVRELLPRTAGYYAGKGAAGILKLGYVKPLEDIPPGLQFGQLTVLGEKSRERVRSGRHYYWRRMIECRCDCGNTKIIELRSLTRGQTKTCGDKTVHNPGVIAARRHGKSFHPLFQVWKAMVSRCHNPNAISYPRYGGRGIKVCGSWHDVSVFIADIEREIGPRPEGKRASGRAVYSLDRIDNDGDYRPGNVRWATLQEQQRNTRKSDSARTGT